MPRPPVPRAAPLALALALAALAPPARGEDLQNLVENLYGGDGKITLLSVNSPAHDAAFDASKGLSTIHGIERTLRGIAKNLPIDAGSASFSYEFNPATGEPERVTTEGLGPLFTQRANTLGQWHFDTAFAWSHVDFQYLDGKKISSNLGFAAPLANPPPGGNFAFENDHVDVNVYIRSVEDIYSFFFVAGITDWLDLSAVLMFINQDLTVRTHATLVGSFHRFDPTPGRLVAPNSGPTDAPDDGGHGTAFGMGDTLLRFKWAPLKAIFGAAPPTRDYFDFALLGTMTVPTGDQRNLLGSGGAPDFRLLGIFSKTFDEWFEPHINLGWKWSIEAGGRDDFLYAAGLAVKITDWFTTYADVSGRKEERRDGKGTDIVDLLAGFKVNPISKLVIGFNILYPLTEPGLQPDYIPSLAVEWVW
jgi:hypothetical protein